MFPSEPIQNFGARPPQAARSGTTFASATLGERAMRPSALSLRWSSSKMAKHSLSLPASMNSGPQKFHAGAGCPSESTSST